MPVLHVVMPVFNEGPTLEQILSRVLDAPLPENWTLDVTMVDDGSRSDAAGAARQAVRERISLVVHPHNRGKGAALLTGFD
ncbi:MAG: glycosyltransferase, partial [Phycisphaerae bacterium]|nr:glycosyltransferase [Phycisphaerae bacterium]